MGTVAGSIIDHRVASTPPVALSGLVPGAVNANFSQSGGNPRITGNNAPVGGIQGGSLVLQNTPIDLTIRTLIVSYDTNQLNRFETLANDGFFLALIDGANNYRTFLLGGSDYADALTGTFAAISLNAQTFTAGGYESGVLDFSNITGIEIFVTRGGNNPILAISRISSIPELVLTGAVGRFNDFDDFIAVPNTRVRSNFLAYSRLTIGDNAVTTDFNGVSTTQEFLSIATLADFDRPFYGAPNTVGLTLQGESGGTVSFQGFDSKGRAFQFLTIDPSFGGDLTNSRFSGYGNTNFGRVAIPSTTVIDADSAVQVNGSFNFNNVRRLDLAPADALDNSQYANAASGDGVVFTGAPGTYPFQIRFDDNASIADLSINPTSAGIFRFPNLSVGDGYTLKVRNLSATDAISLDVGGLANAIVDAGAGLTIIAPQPTITFSNIPVNGCIFTIYDTSVNPNGVVATIVGSTQTTETLSFSTSQATIRVQIISPPGVFNEINLNLPNGDQTIDVGGIANTRTNYLNPDLSPAF